MDEREKVYDIKTRTLQFAIEIVRLVSALPRSTAGYALGRQVITQTVSPHLNEVDELVRILTTIVKRAEGHSSFSIHTSSLGDS